MVNSPSPSVNQQDRDASNRTSTGPKLTAFELDIQRKSQELTERVAKLDQQVASSRNDFKLGFGVTLVHKEFANWKVRVQELTRGKGANTKEEQQLLLKEYNNLYKLTLPRSPQRDQLVAQELSSRAPKEKEPASQVKQSKPLSKLEAANEYEKILRQQLKYHAGQIVELEKQIKTVQTNYPGVNAKSQDSIGKYLHRIKDLISFRRGALAEAQSDLAEAEKSEQRFQSLKRQSGNTAERMTAMQDAFNNRVACLDKAQNSLIIRPVDTARLAYADNARDVAADLQKKTSSLELATNMAELFRDGAISIGITAVTANAAAPAMVAATGWARAGILLSSIAKGFGAGMALYTTTGAIKEIGMMDAGLASPDDLRNALVNNFKTDLVKSTKSAVFAAVGVGITQSLSKVLTLKNPEWSELIIKRLAGAGGAAGSSALSTSVQLIESMISGAKPNELLELGKQGGIGLILSSLAGGLGADNPSAKGMLQKFLQSNGGQALTGTFLGLVESYVNDGKITPEEATQQIIGAFQDLAMGRLSTDVKDPRIAKMFIDAKYAAEPNLRSIMDDFIGNKPQRGATKQEVDAYKQKIAAAYAIISNPEVDTQFRTVASRYANQPHYQGLLRQFVAEVGQSGSSVRTQYAFETLESSPEIRDQLQKIQKSGNKDALALAERVLLDNTVLPETRDGILGALSKHREFRFAVSKAVQQSGLPETTAHARLIQNLSDGLTYDSLLAALTKGTDADKRLGSAALTTSLSFDPARQQNAQGVILTFTDPRARTALDIAPGILLRGGPLSGVTATPAPTRARDLVEYKPTTKDVQAKYVNLRKQELTQGGMDEQAATKMAVEESGRVLAFLDKTNGKMVIALGDPNKISTANRVFIGGVIAHEKAEQENLRRGVSGVDAEVLAYEAQQAYYKRNGFEMQFSKDGWSIIASDSPTLNSRETIRDFVSTDYSQSQLASWALAAVQGGRLERQVNSLPLNELWKSTTDHLKVTTDMGWILELRPVADSNQIHIKCDAQKIDFRIPYDQLTQSLVVGGRQVISNNIGRLPFTIKDLKIVELVQTDAIPPRQFATAANMSGVEQQTMLNTIRSTAMSSEQRGNIAGWLNRIQNVPADQISLNNLARSIAIDPIAIPYATKALLVATVILKGANPASAEVGDSRLSSLLNKMGQWPAGPRYTMVQDGLNILSNNIFGHAFDQSQNSMRSAQNNPDQYSQQQTPPPDIQARPTQLNAQQIELEQQKIFNTITDPTIRLIPRQIEHIGFWVREIENLPNSGLDRVKLATDIANDSEIPYGDIRTILIAAATHGSAIPQAVLDNYDIRSVENQFALWPDADKAETIRVALNLLSLRTNNRQFRQVQSGPMTGQGPVQGVTDSQYSPPQGSAPQDSKPAVIIEDAYDIDPTAGVRPTIEGILRLSANPPPHIPKGDPLAGLPFAPQKYAGANSKPYVPPTPDSRPVLLHSCVVASISYFLTAQGIRPTDIPGQPKMSLEDQLLSELWMEDRRLGHHPQAYVTGGARGNDQAGDYFNKSDLRTYVINQWNAVAFLLEKRGFKGSEIVTLANEKFGDHILQTLQGGGALLVGSLQHAVLVSGLHVDPRTRELCVTILDPMLSNPAKKCTLKEFFEELQRKESNAPTTNQRVRVQCLVKK